MYAYAGPVDVERQCGVILPNGQPCARSLTCKSHSMGAKRAVAGRSLPYDMLLAAYQKKNQARQQSRSALCSTKFDSNKRLQRLLSTPTPRSRKTTTPMLALSTATKRRRLSWPLSPNGIHSLSWLSLCSTPFGASIKSIDCNNNWQPLPTMDARIFSRSVATGLSDFHRVIQAIALQYLSCLCWTKKTLLARKRTMSQTCQAAQPSHPCRLRDKCPSVVRLRRLRKHQRSTVQGLEAEKSASFRE